MKITKTYNKDNKLLGVYKEYQSITEAKIKEVNNGRDLQKVKHDKKYQAQLAKLAIEGELIQGIDKSTFLKQKRLDKLAHKLKHQRRTVLKINL